MTLIRLRLLILLIFFTCASLAHAQSGFVQVIHNSALPTVAMVDIYVNGDKPPSLDDLSFREATPFLELPAGQDIEVAFAHHTSQDPEDSVFATFNVGQLEPDENIVVIANGVFGFEFENPDPQNRDIQLAPFQFVGKQVADNPENVEFLLFHGATDAPILDIYRNDDGTPLLADFDYGAASEYLAFSAEDFTLTLTEAGNAGNVIGEYYAEGVSANRGGAGIIFTSGFLTLDNEPDDVPDDYDFGVYAALPNGTVVELGPPPQIGTAYLQFVHNSIQATAPIVDIYLNGVKPQELDNLEFRNATPFLEVEADDNPFIVTVAGRDSENASDDVIGTFELDPLNDDESLTIFLNGADGDGYHNPDPDNRDISFTLYLLPSQRQAEFPTNVDIGAFNGVTDAPITSVLYNIGGFDIDYAAMAAQGPLLPDIYEITVEMNGEVQGQYRADITNFAGMAGFMFASGVFSDLNTVPNLPESYEYALFLVLSDGRVIRLQRVSGVDDEPRRTAAQIIEVAPNPITYTALARYRVSEPGNVKIDIVDALGQTIYSDVQGYRQPGEYAFSLDAASWAQGRYTLKVESGGAIHTQALTVVK